MGLVKHAVPKPVRRKLVETVDQALPDGVIKRNLANGITVLGAVLVGVGTKVDGKVGLGLRAVGEALDDIDGDTSRAFGISSEFGAFLDVILDKAKMATELKVLWRHTGEMGFLQRSARRTALGVIATKHASNAAINSLAFVSGVETESSTLGKINLWIDGTAVAAFGVSDVTEPGNEINRKAELAGYALTAVGMPVGALATLGYYRDFRAGLAEQANNTTAELQPTQV